VGGENRSRYFLLGVVLGGLIGAGVAIWVMESRRVRFRQQSGGGFGSRVAEFISVVRDEFIPGLREAMRESPEEEPGEAMTSVEERFAEESET
jgi:hypothetical protein